MKTSRLHKSNSEPEAHLIKAQLANAGIECMLTNGIFTTLMPMYNAMLGGGVQILVKDSDLAAAREVIKDEIATPLIVHWPSGMKKSEFRNQPGHLIDIMATCIEVAGTQYPETFQENQIILLEGVSLIPAFENKELPGRTLFWEHEGNKAVRPGKYKLVSKLEKESEYNWELCDLEVD